MLLWPTFCIHMEMLPVERVVDWERPANLGPLHSLAPLYKTPKLTLLQPWDLDQSCLNKKGAAHHWLSSFWIGLVSVNPLMSYIIPPSPLVWPVYLARKNGKKFWRFWLHHVANPPKIVARKVGRLWSDVREEVWFGSFFQRFRVFWWFLQTYMRSGSFSFWIFIRN